MARSVPKKKLRLLKFLAAVSVFQKDLDGVTSGSVKLGLKREDHFVVCLVSLE